MKRYQCHKVVMAGQINSIVKHPMMEGAVCCSVDIGFTDGTSFRTNGKFIERHKPELGGYVVRYNDDYVSYSPQEAFESGYTEQELEVDEDHHS